MADGQGKSAVTADGRQGVVTADEHQGVVTADRPQHVAVTADRPQHGVFDEPKAVVVTFERRDYALTPSPGEVILPAHGRMIHHDPACLHLTDSRELPRFPAPDRLVWRRLIDSRTSSRPAPSLPGRSPTT
ncbi:MULTISPECIES: hypothetical protein [Streptomyces]|uniref:hypothetical protein n=1 Tax=Streptomyces TaxID=1883 RepID=UPI0015D5156B|nr:MULTISPECIES: hypothetical protein [Streptomyces]